MAKQHKEPSPAFVAARELAKKVSAMTEQERADLVSRIGTCATVEGHALSIHNTVMLFMQRQDVSIVGGFRQWLKAGRCVGKGSTALWIFAPHAKKETDENGEESEGVYFRLVPVFDVSQTVELETAESEAA